MGEASELAEVLSDAFYRRLLTKTHYCLWKTGALGIEDPLDIAQEVLIELYRRFEARELTTTDPTALLRGLASTIAERRAIDAARRAGARRERPAPHPDLDRIGTAEALDRFQRFMTETSSRLRRIDAREKATRVLAFVARREAEDPEARGDYELLVLRHVDGLSYAEIAARRGRRESAEAVRSRLRRLEARIREEFGGAASAPRDGSA